MPCTFVSRTARVTLIITFVTFVYFFTFVYCLTKTPLSGYDSTILFLFDCSPVFASSQCLHNSVSSASVPFFNLFCSLRWLSSLCRGIRSACPSQGIILCITNLKYFDLEYRPIKMCIRDRCRRSADYFGNLGGTLLQSRTCTREVRKE